MRKISLRGRDTMNKPRLVIIGAGGAGLAAALEAAKYDIDILLITKSYYRNQTYKWSSHGGCTWKTHGFNAAVKANDSIEAHIRDTIKGGAYANNPYLVETLCKGAVELIDWLSGLGINFDRNGNEIAARPFGGCGTPRSVFIEDRLGFHIQKTLNLHIDDLIQSGRLIIIENMRALEILKNNNGQVEGLKSINIHTLEYINISCSGVIIADGGGASMYAPTAVSLDKTCDGIVMAIKAGVDVIDMEFVQFHPTGIASNVLVFDGSLVEEVLRFDGAKLINKHGKRFMFDYHALGETATRDEVARGIYREIINGNGYDNQSVMLDIVSCKDAIINWYPALFERLTQAGYDVKNSFHIYVRPTAHFLMGGVKINTNSETSLPGLYVAGESAAGVHGANRLGGNGLSEALVFGRIAGENAAQYCLSTSTVPTIITNLGSFRINSKDYVYAPDCLLNKLRRDMYWHAGPTRNLANLEKMQSMINEININISKIDLGSGSRASMQVQNYFDLKNLVLASDMIVKAAILRKESRGSHYLESYINRNDKFKGIKFSYQNNLTIASNYTYKNYKKELVS